MNKTNFQIIPQTHSIYIQLSERFPDLMKTIREIRFIMTSGNKPRYSQTFIWLTNKDNKECIIQIKTLLSGTQIKWNESSNNNILPLDIQNDLIKKFGNNISIFVPFTYSGRFNQIIIKKENFIICSAISKLLSNKQQISWDNITELYEDSHIMSEIEIKENLISLFRDCVKVDIIGELRNTLTRVRLYNNSGKTREDVYSQLTKEKTVKLVDYISNKQIDYRRKILKEAKQRNIVLELPDGVITSTTHFKYYDNEFRYITTYTIQKANNFNFSNGKRIDLEHFISVIKTKLYNGLEIKSYVITSQSLKECIIIFKCQNCGFEWESTGYLVMANYLKNKKKNNSDTIVCKQCVSHKILTKRYALTCIKNKHPEYDITEMFNDIEKDEDVVNGKQKYLVKCPNISHYGIPHGEFLTSYELIVSNDCGCPKCHRSHMSQKVEAFLYNNHINYKEEYPVKFLCDENTSESKNQKFDFYLPDLNIVIEIQGHQHYEKYHKTESWKMLGEKQWNDNNRRDIAKLKKIQSIDNLTIIFFDDQSSEEYFRGYKVVKNLNDLAILLNIKSPILIDEYNDGYAEYKDSELLKLKEKCRQLYLNNDIQDLKNSSDKKIRSLCYQMFHKYNKWSKEFKKEKDELKESMFLKEFLKEAEKYNFRKEDFYKIHPPYSDSMTIRANARGYINKYLTEGYVCILPNQESYVFKTLNEIEEKTGIDWRAAKKLIENKSKHMGLRFDYNQQIRYKNDETILENIKSFLNKQRNDKKRPLVMLDKNNNFLYAFKSDREIENSGLVGRTSIRQYKNGSEHLMKGMIRFKVVSWDEYIELSKKNDNMLLNRIIQKYKQQ